MVGHPYTGQWTEGVISKSSGETKYKCNATPMEEAENRNQEGGGYNQAIALLKTFDILDLILK